MSDFLKIKNTPDGREAAAYVKALIEKELNPLRKKVAALEKEVEILKARLPTS
jgi:hypothetical protein